MGRPRSRRPWTARPRYTVSHRMVAATTRLRPLALGRPLPPGTQPIGWVRPGGRPQDLGKQLFWLDTITLPAPPSGAAGRSIQVRTGPAGHPSVPTNTRPNWALTPIPAISRTETGFAAAPRSRSPRLPKARHSGRTLRPVPPQASVALTCATRQFPARRKPWPDSNWFPGRG